METKLSQVRKLMAGGDMRGAVLMASKFGDLGHHRPAILSAREAYLRPEFQQQLKRDPEVLIAAGAAAMCDRFGHV